MLTLGAKHVADILHPVDIHPFSKIFSFVLLFAS